VKIATRINNGNSLVSDSVVEPTELHLGSCKRGPESCSIVWIVRRVRKLLLDLEESLFSRDAVLQKLAVGGPDVTCQIVPEDRGARVAQAGKLHLANPNEIHESEACQRTGSLSRGTLCRC
jgi:hypothetical protein